MVQDFVPNNLRMTVIRVISYENKNFAGYVENPFLGESLRFSNLTQLLLMLDELADELNYPRRACESRSFLAAQKHRPFQLIPADTNRKPIASFKICIMFRQNASWQGSCEWIDQGESANFRSALELIQLMDQVLENYSNVAEAQ
jgi:hypothetical protein